MDVGFFVIITIITLMWVARNVHEDGYNRGRALSRMEARAEVEAYKAEQIWEYDAVEQPLMRRNRLTQEIEQRFAIGNMMNEGFTNWRKVIHNSNKDKKKTVTRNK